MLLNQDDPSKCTALKLVKFRLAIQVRTFHRQSIVLNPFSDILLSAGDRSTSESICAVDCSWEKIHHIAEKQTAFRSRNNRRLPFLLAGNPTNYSKVGKLSTAEALAGSTYILGNKSLSIELMSKFKWGHTFLELNSSLLEEYANAKNLREIADLERSYFPQLY